MKKYNLLYVEDDSTIALLTKDALDDKYNVTHCVNGLEAKNAFNSQLFDLCILDIMMPKIDGFALAAHIRQLNSNIPILFLSAKTLKEDRIKGLKLGADDYLVKPFSIEELELKIQIFIKRSQKDEVEEKLVYSIGHLIFDVKNYTLIDKDKKMVLTQRESELLQLFVEHKNEVLKRAYILHKLWGSDDYFLGRSLDVFVSRLRKRIALQNKATIINLHGIGFKYIEVVE